MKWACRRGENDPDSHHYGPRHVPWVLHWPWCGTRPKTAVRLLSHLVFHLFDITARSHEALCRGATQVVCNWALWAWDPLASTLALRKVFNMEIIYYQRTRMLPADEKLYSATYCSTLDELLSTADIVSLHCLLNKKTEGMISFKEFATMKDGVFFINTSRGPLANEEALIQALESGKICRARLDVFHGEPKIK